MKWILFLLFISAFAVVGAVSLIPDIDIGEAEHTELQVGADKEPSYFAELDENGVVLRVIAADQAFIDSGKMGNPARWIPTYVESAYAGKGYQYDQSKTRFVAPKPYASSTFNDTTGEWTADADDVKRARQSRINQ